MMATVLAVIAVVVVDQAEEARLRQAERSEVLARVTGIRAQLENALATPLLMGTSMVALIAAEGDVTDARFERLAAELLPNHRNIRNITLARGTLISDIYPRAGNESALGKDYRDQPRQWPAVERAITSRQQVLSGPVGLIQGGHGLLARSPVFVADPQGGRRFFGLVSIVIDFDGILSDTGLTQPGLPVQLAIRGLDGMGADGAMVWGDEGVFSRQPVTADVELPYGSWRLAAIPAGGWRKGGDLGVLRLMGGFLVLVIAVASTGAARHWARAVESELRYRAVAETAPVAVLAHRGGQVVFGNTEAARILGADSPAEVVGMAMPDFERDEAGGTTLLIHGGAPLRAEVSSRPVTIDGEPAVLTVIHDVSRRYRAESEREDLIRTLRQSNEDLQQFAYIASHDLQEPLRSVASYVQLLARRYQGKLDADADLYIGYAVAGAKRMQTLIHDLLQFSRLQEHGDEVLSAPAGAAVAAALSDLAEAVTRSGAVVETGELPNVAADPRDLERLFQNLIGNALKYRHPDVPPRVSITAEPHEDRWCFAVRDNGIGIKPEYHQQVFAIFRRLHSRSDYEGTGIGLAICRKIVERYGGRIWLESDGGEGCTFRFTLPGAHNPGLA